MKEILDLESWQDALRQLCSDPPSGDTETNRTSVDEEMRAHPLRSLFPEEILGGDLPRMRVATDEEKRNKRLVERETVSIQLHALVLHDALKGVWDKWGPIPLEELAAFSASKITSTPELAAALARAFHRFWNGDAEGAVFTAVPRLEALARALVLAGGLPAYRTQRASTPGPYPGLGALLGSCLPQDSTNPGSGPSGRFFRIPLVRTHETSFSTASWTIPPKRRRRLSSLAFSFSRCAWR